MNFTGFLCCLSCVANAVRVIPTRHFRPWCGANGKAPMNLLSGASGVKSRAHHVVVYGECTVLAAFSDMPLVFLS